MRITITGVAVALAVALSTATIAPAVAGHPAPGPGASGVAHDPAGPVHQDSPSPAAGSQGLAVTVPAVAFASSIRATAGHLRTPVVLTEPGVTGSARVLGAPECRAALVPGRAAWIDCDVPSARVVIRVRLSDGRLFAAAR